ncbi:MAG: hypothetical protein P4N41_21420 [Negativicutes bacterium]|nr:hypothetical protein [Negativicutes bacterium]
MEKETIQAGNLKFELDDLIGNAVLTITDMNTKQSVSLRSEAISKTPDRMQARAILKEFLHHI